MNGLVIGALVAFGMVQQTDTVFPAQGARLLELDLTAGSVVVTGWDRDEIAVRAEHSSRAEVHVRRTRDGARLEVEAVANRGPVTIVDYEISLPRGMALEVDAMSADVSVDGVRGGVDASVNQGDVTLRNVAGAVKVYSTAGRVLVENAAGDVEAETAAGEIRLLRVAGAIGAESAGGDIILEGVTSSSVDVGTVGGRIHYDGTYQAGGSYLFGNHGGTVTLVVPDGASATFHLATVYGSVVDSRSAEPKRYEGGQRHTLQVGAGAALVEAETFGGRILLVRKGAEGSAPPPARSRGEGAH
ncbi:MAG: hypothetical protein AMXMBFR53_20800 [Gemmatimonadota bacterium]